MKILKVATIFLLLQLVTSVIAEESTNVIKLRESQQCPGCNLKNSLLKGKSPLGFLFLP